MLVEIYGLVDPCDGQLLYIGKANCAAKRLQSHLRDAHRRTTPVYAWIRKLGRAGLVPVVIVLSRCAMDAWQEEERRLIALFRTRGRLLNVADGGNQPFCATETRARNGRSVAVARTSTPQKARVWALKRYMGDVIRRGELTERNREKLREAARKAPHIFGKFASL